MPDYPPPQSVIKAIRDGIQDPTMFYYTPIAGIHSLRQEIAHYTKSVNDFQLSRVCTLYFSSRINSSAYTAESVLISHGAKQVLYEVRYLQNLFGLHSTDQNFVVEWFVLIPVDFMPVHSIR